MNPLVSVVIPTYNRAPDLERAIKSVVAQSYVNWEILVVDNHSVDATDSVVANIGDVRVRLLKIHNEGIIAKSRNLGIEHAQGVYVAFLDSDDWWAPDKLRRSVLALDTGGDVSYHDLFTVRSHEQCKFNERITSSEPVHPMFVALLCTGMSMPNSSVVVRRELLTRIGGLSENSDLISVEDYDTWIRLSRETERFVRIPECLGYYWVGGGNNSAASPRQATCIRALYAQYFDELPVVTRRLATGFLAYRVGRIAQLHGDFVTAGDDLLCALRHPIDLTYRAKAGYFLIRSLLSRIFS